MSSALRRLCLLMVAAAALCCAFPAFAADAPQTFPLSAVKPGMTGVMYTIFQGDQIQKVDLQVIGVLQNALGPKQDVILVKLLGDQAAETGVVAGMSGSPVYIDGKLVGALSLKLGAFTKEAIGGVTPIADMLQVAQYRTPGGAQNAETRPGPVRREFPNSATVSTPNSAALARPVAVGGGQFLVPIETPLVTTGLYPQSLAFFQKQFSPWGMAAMAGGTAPPSPADSHVKPGDMVGIDLIRGDLSVSAGCTVTTVEANRILACGHPLFGFGAVQMPISAAHVVMTLASAQASTKVITTGGVIGTLTQDRQTAISGTLGAGPPMVPVNLTLDTPDGENKYHFEVVQSPQLTAQLVATAAYNGITGSAAYDQSTTLQLDGNIVLKGHAPVRLEDLFAPTDQTTPAGFFLATSVESDFAQIYSNPYEQPQIQRVDLTVKAMPDRRWAMIDDAWVEKSEVRPGESVNIRVLLRPYRGAPFIQVMPITIPEQSARGTLELVVSDAAFLNRNVESLAYTSQGQLPGLGELINLINRQRHNDHLYATLLQPTPTMLVEDKELPNVPLSAINVLDQRRNLGSARLLWESTAGEWSVDMHQVIAGQRILTITVK
ncbi:MAG: SpoIVB peptidase S55 domain-containing protein [Candidatus Acidiferrales bacterium]